MPTPASARSAASPPLVKTILPSTGTVFGPGSSAWPQPKASSAPPTTAIREHHRRASMNLPPRLVIPDRLSILFVRQPMQRVDIDVDWNGLHAPVAEHKLANIWMPAAERAVVEVLNGIGIDITVEVIFHAVVTDTREPTEVVVVVFRI